MIGQKISGLSEISQKRGRKYKYLGISFSGYDELTKAFNDLNNEDLIFSLGDATVEAANVVMKKAKTKIHTTPGSPDLVDALTVHKPGRKRGKRYQIFARVGFDARKSEGAYYGAQVELGHRLVTHKKEVGTVKEHPFLRPAADETKDQVADIIIDKMMQIIQEEWSK